MGDWKVYLLALLIGILTFGCGNSGGDENPGSSLPTTWEIAVVDSNGNVGQYSSIAIDGDGKAHIAYFDYVRDEQIGGDTIQYGNLKYANNLNGSWEPVMLDAGSGLTPRIDVDRDNKIHIVHSKLGVSDVSTLLDLKYTTNKSGSWQTVTISSQVVRGVDASIVVDSNDKVHISLRNEEGSEGGLRHVTDTSGIWTWFDVDTNPSAGNDTDIAVDKNGDIHISYLDKNVGLKYATNMGGSWTVEVVDSTPNVGWNTSIAIDANNKVHISYSDPSPTLTPPGNGYLKYATNASGQWITQVIDDRNAGFFTGIAVDSQDNIHICYYTWDGNIGRLRYATDISGSWVMETVDESGIVGLYCAIAIDQQGSPHISYYDYINQNLKYAKR